MSSDYKPHNLQSMSQVEPAPLTGVKITLPPNVASEIEFVSGDYEVRISSGNGSSEKLLTFTQDEAISLRCSTEHNVLCVSEVKRGQKCIAITPPVPYDWIIVVEPSSTLSIFDPPKSITLDLHCADIQKFDELRLSGPDKAENETNQQIQTLKFNELRLNGVKTPTSVLNALEVLLSAVDALCDTGLGVSASLCSEIAHFTLQFFFFHTSVHKVILPEAGKKSLIAHIQETLQHVRTLMSPTAILEYELSMILKGVSILPSDDTAVASAVFDVVGGVVGFAVTGNPNGLICAIGKGAMLCVRSALTDHEGSIFKVVHQMDSVKRLLLLKKLEWYDCSKYIASKEEIQTKQRGFFKDIQNIVQTVEHDVVLCNRRWEVLFAWVKILSEIILTNPVVVKQYLLPNELQSEAKALEDAGWLIRFRKESYIIPFSFPDSIQCKHSVKRLAKCWLTDQRAKGSSLSPIEAYIYFGDSGEIKFHGLQHYISFGEQPNAWGQLRSVGGQLLEDTTQGEPLDVSTLMSLPWTDQLMKHLDLVCDQTLNRLFGELILSLHEFAAVYQEKNLYQTCNLISRSVDESTRVGDPGDMIEQATCRKTAENTIAQACNFVRENRDLVDKAFYRTLEYKNLFDFAFQQHKAYVKTYCDLVESYVKAVTVDGIRNKLSEFLTLLRRYSFNSDALAHCSDDAVVDFVAEKNLYDMRVYHDSVKVEDYLPDIAAQVGQRISLKSRGPDDSQNFGTYFKDRFGDIINAASFTSYLEDFERSEVGTYSFQSSAYEFVDISTVLGVFQDMQNSFVDMYLSASTLIKDLVVVSVGVTIPLASSLQQQLTSCASNQKNCLIDTIEKKLQLFSPVQRSQFLGESARKAAATIRRVVPIDLKTQSTFFNVLVSYFGDHSWRIRERVALTLFQIQGRKSEFDARIGHDIEMKIVHRKVQETNMKVKRMLQSPEYASSMVAILRGTWENEQDTLRQAIGDRLDQIELLQKQIYTEPDMDVRKLLVQACTDEQTVLDEELNNLTDMSAQMGVVIQFLNTMKKKLDHMNETLNDIREDVSEMKVGIQYLVGRSIPQLFRFRLQQLQADPVFDEIHIPIQAVPVPETPEDKPSELKAHVDAFLCDKCKNTILIKGQSGSGKSVFMRRLSKHLLQNWSASSEKCRLVPIWCALPSLEQPLTNLIGETLINYYGFDQRRVQQLKNEVSAENAKYHLVLILDSYDEIKQQFQYKNLYDTNDLEEWGPPVMDGLKPYPKVIITCRSEHTEPHQSYKSWFYPYVQASYRGYDPESQFLEMWISDFSSQTVLYLNKYYERELRRLYLKGDDTSEDTWAAFALHLNTNSSELLCGIGEAHDAAVSSQMGTAHADKMRKFIRRRDVCALWSPQRYHAAAEELGDFLTTPFMLSVVVQVLPKISKSSIIPQECKNRFLRSVSDKQNAEKYWDIIKRCVFTDVDGPSAVDSSIRARSDYIREELSKDSSIPVDYIMDILDDIFHPRPMVRFDLYKAFVQHVIGNEVQKLVARRYGGVPIPVDDLHWKVLHYSERLALQMVRHGVSRVNHQIVGKHFRKDDAKWDVFFKHDTQIQADIQRAAPVKGTNGSYAFIHKSLQEYFVAAAAYESIMEHEVLAESALLNSLFDLFLRSGRQWGPESMTMKQREGLVDQMLEHFDASSKRCDRPHILSFLSKIDNVVHWCSDFPITVQILESEPAICTNFLCDKVRTDERFRISLLSLVQLSKIRQSMGPVSATAITILNQSRVSFSGMDLRGICIPGARLDYAVFHNADLRYSDFGSSTEVGDEVSARSIILSGANLSGANVSALNLHEPSVDRLRGPKKNYINDVVISAEYDETTGGALLFGKGMCYVCCSDHIASNRLMFWAPVIQSVEIILEDQIFLLNSRDGMKRIVFLNDGKARFFIDDVFEYSICETWLAIRADSKLHVFAIRPGEGSKCVLIVDKVAKYKFSVMGSWLAVQDHTEENKSANLRLIYMDDEHRSGEMSSAGVTNLKEFFFCTKYNLLVIHHGTDFDNVEKHLRIVCPSAKLSSDKVDDFCRIITMSLPQNQTLTVISVKQTSVKYNPCADSSYLWIGYQSESMLKLLKFECGVRVGDTVCLASDGDEVITDYTIEGDWMAAISGNNLFNMHRLKNNNIDNNTCCEPHISNVREVRFLTSHLVAVLSEGKWMFVVRGKDDSWKIANVTFPSAAENFVLHNSWVSNERSERSELFFIDSVPRHSHRVDSVSIFKFSPNSCWLGAQQNTETTKNNLFLFHFDQTHWKAGPGHEQDCVDVQKFEFCCDQILAFTCKLENVYIFKILNLKNASTMSVERIFRILGLEYTNTMSFEKDCLQLKDVNYFVYSANKTWLALRQHKSTLHLAYLMSTHQNVGRNMNPKQVYDTLFKAICTDGGDSEFEKQLNPGSYVTIQGDGIIFSPDEKWAVFAMENILKIINLRDGVCTYGPRREIGINAVLADCTFSPDSMWLTIKPNNERTVYLLYLGYGVTDVSSDSRVQNFTDIVNCAFTGNSNWLVLTEEKQNRVEVTRFLNLRYLYAPSVEDVVEGSSHYVSRDFKCVNVRSYTERLECIFIVTGLALICLNTSGSSYVILIHAVANRCKFSSDEKNYIFRKPGESVTVYSESTKPSIYEIQPDQLQIVGKTVTLRRCAKYVCERKSVFRAEYTGHSTIDVFHLTGGRQVVPFCLPISCKRDLVNIAAPLRDTGVYDMYGFSTDGSRSTWRLERSPILSKPIALSSEKISSLYVSKNTICVRYSESTYLIINRKTQQVTKKTKFGKDAVFCRDNWLASLHNTNSLRMVCLKPGMEGTWGPGGIGGIQDVGDFKYKSSWVAYKVRNSLKLTRIVQEHRANWDGDDAVDVKESITDFDFSPNGNYLMVWVDTTLSLYNLQSVSGNNDWKSVFQGDGAHAPKVCFKVVADAPKACFTEDDNWLIIYEETNGHFRISAVCDGPSVEFKLSEVVDFKACRNLVAARTRNDKLHVFQLTGEIGSIESIEDYFWVGGYLAIYPRTAGDNVDAKVLQVYEAKNLCRPLFSEQVDFYRCSSDGAWLVTRFGVNFSIRNLEGSDINIILELTIYMVSTMDLYRFNKSLILATGHHDGTIRVWQIEPGDSCNIHGQFKYHSVLLEVYGNYLLDLTGMKAEGLILDTEGSLFLDKWNLWERGAYLGNEQTLRCDKNHDYRISSYMYGRRYKNEMWKCEKCLTAGKGKRWVCLECEVNICWDCIQKMSRAQNIPSPLRRLYSAMGRHFSGSSIKSSQYGKFNETSRDEKINDIPFRFSRLLPLVIAGGLLTLLLLVITGGCWSFIHLEWIEYLSIHSEHVVYANYEPGLFVN